MKRYKLTTNLGLKIMAFIFAVFLWLIVVNLDTPIVSQRYAEIPVTIVNDDIITSAGDVYQVVGEQTVSVAVYANREVQDHISRDDIVATADIREMDTSTGLVPVQIEIPNYAGKYESAEATPRNLQIQREKSGKKVLALTISTSGQNPPDGYMLGDMTVSPENVTVTGPESVLNQISNAVAVIEVEGLTEDTKVTAELRFYDANGNPVNQSQLETNLGEGGITVSVEVLKVKSVPVEFSVSGTPADGYQYTGVTTVPETVQICGKADDIDDVEAIAVPASALDISGASEPVEKTVDITPYLPDGVSLADEDAGNVTVTAMIEQDGTRTISFLVSSIRMSNLADDLQVSYEPDAEITLQFTGDESRLEVLDISNAVSVNLESYTTPGTYNIPVRVDVPDGITLENDVSVQLTLKEKTEEAATDSTGSTGGTNSANSSSSGAAENQQDSEGQEEETDAGQ